MNDHQDSSILIVDDEAIIRSILRRALNMAGYKSIFDADCVDAAREVILKHGPFALVISDIRMPGDSGLMLLQELAHCVPDTVVIMATGVDDVRTAVQSLQSGAYDFVLKPFEISTIQLAVGRALRRRQLEIENRNFQEQLEKMVELKTQELDVQARALSITRHAMLKGLCRLTEFRDPETGSHLDRMAWYCKILAKRLRQDSVYSPQVTDLFVRQLFESAPLHDIGKVGIPDSILLKPDRLTPDEFAIMQEHTTIGCKALKSIKSEMGDVEGSFINMATEVALNHHERWDGGGYPCGYSGVKIPLSARIAALADMYDACRSPRIYRPKPVPVKHVVEIIEQGAGNSFDPALVEAFFRCRDEFQEIEDRFKERGVNSSKENHLDRKRLPSLTRA